MQALTGLNRVVNLDKWRGVAERLLNDVVASVSSTHFMVQLGFIIASGLLAFWLAPLLLRLLRRLFAPLLAQRAIDAIHAIVASAAVPALWALFLWLEAEIGRSLEIRMGLTGAAIELLVAWIVIRLLSHGVRHPVWSRAIFVSAFTVAALDIMGLLGLIEASLNRVGFAYGGARITGLNVVRALIVLAVLLWLVGLIRNFLERRVAQTQTLSPSLQALLLQFSKLGLPALAVVAALPVLGLNLTALTVFGGAFAVGAGLGLQKIIANLVSGFILLGTNAIKPGDVIAVKDISGNATYGRISGIGANFVSLRTRGGTEFLVPNETLLTTSVENWTYSDSNIRLKLPFNIVYGSDMRRAVTLAVEAISTVPRVLAEPKPVCQVKNFGAGAIEMELRFWIGDPMNGIANVRSDCLLQLWDHLNKNDVKFPIPGPMSVVVSQPPAEAA